MKRTIPIFLLITLVLANCMSPDTTSTSAPEVNIPVPTSTPTSPPTETATTAPSPTATSQPQPSPTSTALPASLTPTPQTFPTLQPLTSGEIITITQVQMFNPLTGWGVGTQAELGARILYTEDGGQTWDDRTPPDGMANQPDEIDSAWAHFLDKNHAWVVYASRRMPPALQDKFVWRTDNAGATWERSMPLQADGMEDIFIPEGFASAGLDRGWLLVHVGGGMNHDYSYLYRSANGGRSWERITDPYSGGIQSLRNTGVAFADGTYGWVSKDNLGVMPGAFFEQTTDGGGSWEQAFLPNPPELDWFSESSLCQTSQPTFLDETHGILIVKCRLPDDIQRGIDWSLTYIYQTADRGASWYHQRLPTPVDSLLFLDKDTGWALGRDLYRTTDGGLTWSPFKMVNWDGDFSFVDSQQGWAVARNEGEIALVVTENGGQTWQIIQPRAR